MIFKRKRETAQDVALNIARESARRGFPAEAKPVTVRSPFGDAIRWSVIIPNRGVAVIDDTLRIVVASSNRPAPSAPAFAHTNTEADTEQILRNLPLP